MLCALGARSPGRLIGEIYFTFVNHEYRLKLYYHARIFACKMLGTEKLMIRLLISDFVQHINYKNQSTTLQIHTLRYSTLQ